MAGHCRFLFDRAPWLDTKKPLHLRGFDGFTAGLLDRVAFKQPKAAKYSNPLGCSC